MCGVTQGNYYTWATILKKAMEDRTCGLEATKPNTIIQSIKTAAGL